MATPRNGPATTAERPPSTSVIPMVIRESIRYLFPRVRTKGLFRVPGNAADMKSIMRRFDQPSGHQLFSFSFLSNKGTDLSDVQHVHSVAGLIPMYLRARPPLCTEVLHPCFIAAVDVDDDDEKIRCLRKVVRTLPTCNFFILAVLVEFLSFVSTNAEWNQMTSYNLAVVFAPVLLRAQASADDLAAVSAAQQAVHAVQLLIDHFQDVFSLVDDDEAPPPSPPVVAAAPPAIDPQQAFGDAPLPPTVVSLVRTTSQHDADTQQRPKSRPNSFAGAAPAPSHSASLTVAKPFDASRPPSSVAPEPPDLSSASPTLTSQSAPTIATTAPTIVVMPSAPSPPTRTVTASGSPTRQTPRALQMDAFKPFGTPLQRFKQTMDRQSMLMQGAPVFTDYSAPLLLPPSADAPCEPPPPPPPPPPSSSTAVAARCALEPTETGDEHSCSTTTEEGGAVVASIVAQLDKHEPASPELIRTHLRERNSFLHRVLFHDNTEESAVVERIQQTRSASARKLQVRMVASSSSSSSPSRSARPVIATASTPTPSGYKIELKIAPPPPSSSQAPVQRPSLP